VSANEEKPPPTWCKNSRREVCPQNVFAGLSMFAMSLF
jgi:hypothetical protein